MDSRALKKIDSHSFCQLILCFWGGGQFRIPYFTIFTDITVAWLSFILFTASRSVIFLKTEVKKNDRKFRTRDTLG